MDPLAVEVVGGAIVALLSALAGALINRRLFHDRSILSVPAEASPKHSYTHLSGKWYAYHIARDQSLDTERFWLYEEANWRTKNHLVEGRSTVFHPESPLDYLWRGEVRGGKIILVGNCVQDGSDFVAHVFPNIYSYNLLIGVWIGADWQRKLIIAPIVYSRSEMEADKLNQVLSCTDLNGMETREASRLVP